MAKSRYVISAPEGVDFVGAQVGVQHELGDQVELDLRADQQRALIAAGWLEHDEKKKEEK